MDRRTSFAMTNRGEVRHCEPFDRLRTGQGVSIHAFYSFFQHKPIAMQPAVYILASQPRGTLYVGVTSDLVQRVWQHKHDMAEGFSQKYGVHTLVYFELHATMYDAISREKQLKAGSRAKKVALIEAMNSNWGDLYPGLL
jgi:putative endonuclease